MIMKRAFFFLAIVCFVSLSAAAQAEAEKAEQILNKAVEKMGGEKYLQVKTVYGTGLFTIFRDGEALLPQKFVDVIAFPNSERTEFKSGGVKTVQTNSGNSGWIFDGAGRVLNDQTPEQVADFHRGLKVSLDNLLRGAWRKDGGKLSYIGRREASLGKRNEVIRLTYADGFWVEFEFSATDGMPMKALYERENAEGEKFKEDDRYAQFVNIHGALAPFIIDHFRNGKQTSRINYQTLEFNKMIPASIFAKPADVKDLKKDLKF